MKDKIKKLMNEMTLEEKASLCSGLDFWHTKTVERLNIQNISMSDGPHGLRYQDEEADNFGINDSVPATCFPSGATLACSWDRELMNNVGKVLGKESKNYDVNILLGPAINIKRSPLCGRNFEYLSEDPYLSSELSTNYINGVQSEGVGTSVKHFAANNQEHNRMSIDTIIDERTLREIYLASFEGAVKQGKPWTIMCSYNKINGEFASENNYLLTKVLREDWGYEGIVVSDWGAVNDRVKGIKAGLDLEMPSCFGISDKEIVAAVKNKELCIDVLNKTVERMLNIIYKAKEAKKEEAISLDSHHETAKTVATDCMVLLKNEDDILPLKKDMKVAVLGAFAKTPRFQGGGSSHVNAYKVDDLMEQMKVIAPNSKVNFAQGFELESDYIDHGLIDEAIEKAKSSDVAIVFLGLPERYESEGYDRKHMRIPENQIALLEEISKVQSKVVIVLCNGAPIEMPWGHYAKGILEGYLGGQGLFGAIAELLYGDVSPSGKLAETFPVKLSDNPSYLNFPGEEDRVVYAEGLFVGYRYYDQKQITPAYPFGFGLSYTNFEYSNITVNKKELSDTENVIVSVKVKNIGKIKGKEIVQLYIRDDTSSVIRPKKELKGFDKIELEPKEEKVVEFILDKRSFAYFNTKINDWHVESGTFHILVGSSSQDIRLQTQITVNSTVEIPKKISENSTIREILLYVEPDSEIYQLVMKGLSDKGLNIEELKNEDSLFGSMVFRSIMRFSGIDVDYKKLFY